MLPTAYHPQIDRQTEQINQKMGTFLRHYVNYQQNNWTEWLIAAEYQYNNKSVVATTRWNGTHSMLTSAKLTEGYLVVGIYKRTRQGALAAFIYYIYTWLLVRATTISIWPLSPCCYLMSITHPPYIYLKATMLPTCALTSYL